MIGTNFVCFAGQSAYQCCLGDWGRNAVSGLIGLALAAPQSLWDGDPLMISVSGALILPLSFFCLTSATRYTQAANISLLMILETVLGPVWVWLLWARAAGKPGDDWRGDCGQRTDFLYPLHDSQKAV